MRSQKNKRYKNKSHRSHLVDLKNHKKNRNKKGGSNLIDFGVPALLLAANQFLKSRNEKTVKRRKSKKTLKRRSKRSRR